MNEDARGAEPCHHAVREIAGPFRCAAGKDSHVAGCERTAHGKLERALVVGEGTEGNRFAACFRDRRREDRTIAVVDLCRAERSSRCHQLVAGREHRNLGLAHHVDLGHAAGGEDADFPRRQECPAPQHHLAARNVGTGIRDELSGARGAAHLDRRRFVILDQVGMLDHQHRIGAAWDDAAGRDGSCRAGLDRKRRGMPADDDLAVEAQPPRQRVARAQGIGGTDRKTVDIGAVEGRNVDRCGHVLRQHAAKRRGQRDLLAGKRRRIDMARKPRARLLGRDHFEELFLPRRAAYGGNELAGAIGLLRLEAAVCLRLRLMARVLSRPRSAPDILRSRTR